MCGTHLLDKLFHGWGLSKGREDGGGDKLTAGILYSTNCSMGGVCRNGREDGGGDKLQRVSSTRQTVPRVGFVEMGGRTVVATNAYINDKQHYG